MYQGIRTRADNAKSVTELQLSLIEKVDFLTVTPEFMEGVLNPIILVETKLAKSRKEIEELRKPETAKLNAVISVFIDAEKDFDACLNKIKLWRNKWEAEKSRRVKQAAADTAALLLKEQQRVNKLATDKAAITALFGSSLQIKQLAFLEAYNKKTATELEAYAGVLRQWKPTYTENDFDALVSAGRPDLTVDESKDLRKALLNEFIMDWTSAFTKQKEDLVDMIPSRIKALTEIPKEDLKIIEETQKAEIVESVVSMITTQNEVAQIITDTANLEAHFSAVTVVPSYAKAKGTVTKRKYVVSSHTDFIKIFQSYIKNDMSKLTVEELDTKFKFMITAANARLNDKVEPEVIEGLYTVEELNTRRGR